jgi:hypothetical protein
MSNEVLAGQLARCAAAEGFGCVVKSRRKVSADRYFLHQACTTESLVHNQTANRE